VEEVEKKRKSLRGAAGKERGPGDYTAVSAAVGENGLVVEKGALFALLP
jgi:hypothetical protein